MKHSPPLLVLALFLSSVVSVHAQVRSIAFPVAGKLYMEVDDSVEIFHNGQKVHHGKIGVSTSNELNLVPGDRLVVHLVNKGGPYGFKLLFVSTDRKFMVNFGIDSYRVLRDPEKQDFTEKEFAAWKDPARRMNRKGKDHLAFKNKADWVWGEKKKGNDYLAVLITKPMFEEFVQ